MLIVLSSVIGKRAIVWNIARSLVCSLLFHVERRTMKLPRAILADDHTLVAEALCGLMALRLDVVAIVPVGHGLISPAAALKPDVLVVQFAMPRSNGLASCRQLRQQM